MGVGAGKGVEPAQAAAILDGRQAPPRPPTGSQNRLAKVRSQNYSLGRNHGAELKGTVQLPQKHVVKARSKSTEEMQPAKKAFQTPQKSLPNQVDEDESKGSCPVPSPGSTQQEQQQT